MYNSFGFEGFPNLLAIWPKLSMKRDRTKMLENMIWGFENEKP